MKWDVILGIASSVGLVHALLFALFLINSRKGSRTSNLLLAALLLSFAIRIFKSTFYAVAGFIPDWLPAVGLISMSLNGPLLWVYLKQLNQEPVDFRTAGLHLIWAVLAASTLFIETDSFMRAAYLIIILATLGYMVFAFSRLRSVRKPDSKEWLLSLIIGFTLVEVVYFLQWTQLEELAYVIATTVSSFVLMFLTYLCLIKYELARKIHRSLDLSDSGHDEAVRMTLRKLILDEEIFRDSNLTLFKLSELLKLKPTKVSSCFQKEFNASFSDYINQLRLGYVTDQLRKAGNSDKIESIDYDAGFSSPSSFYANFKKSFGTSPVEYREMHEPQGR